MAEDEQHQDQDDGPTEPERPERPEDSASVKKSDGGAPQNHARMEPGFSPDTHEVEVEVDDEEFDRECQLPLRLSDYRRGDWVNRREVNYLGYPRAEALGRLRWKKARNAELRRLVEAIPPHLWTFDPERWGDDFEAWKLARAAYADVNGWPDGNLGRIRGQYRARRGEPYDVEDDEW
jgi:hypothetical protein